MEIANILFIIGLLLISIGIVAYINPNFVRLINVPGGPRLKAIISIIVGIILILVSFIVDFPMN